MNFAEKKLASKLKYQNVSEKISSEIAYVLDGDAIWAKRTRQRDEKKKMWTWENIKKVNKPLSSAD